MRARFWALTVAMLALAALATGLAGCAAGRVPSGPANTPVPSKTLRPTFTVTVPKPTLTPTAGESSTASGGQSGSQPSSPTPVPPTATQVPPTAAPSPTPEPAAFTVASGAVNVRSGPGTAYPVIGRLAQGQSFPITGKTDGGDWWQFDYKGKTGWVISTNVTAKGADAVQVAENIPRPPTAAPRPTARPQPVVQATAKPAQTQPQPAATKYGLTGKAQLRKNTNPVVSVWCFVINSAGNGLVSGTIRVLQGGNVVKEQAFNGLMARGDAGYSSEYLYNDGCKVEVPAGDGTYTAYLIEGGSQVSDAYNFTVTGESNRTAIIEWKQR